MYNREYKVGDLIQIGNKTKKLKNRKGEPAYSKKIHYNEEVLVFPVNGNPFFHGYVL